MSKRPQAWMIRMVGTITKSIFKKALRLLVVLVCVVGLAAGMVNIIRIIGGYRSARAEYNALRGQYTYSGAAGSALSTLPTVPPGPDVLALQEQYPDCVGWIVVPGTVIDYPIVQAADNSYYLRRNIDGEKSTPGTLFMDYRCIEGFESFHAIIYGHNMLDGSMFADLPKYIESEFMAQNSTVYLYTPHKAMEYEIVWARSAHVQDEIFQTVDPIAREQKRWLLGMLENAEYSSQSRFITLSTCAETADRRFYRDVVTAVMVNEYPISAIA